MCIDFQLILKEREEELKRLKQQKITEEAEQRRLATEYEQRKHQRILKEMEERELEEAKALLQEKFGKKTKKPIIEGVSNFSQIFFCCDKKFISHGI